MLDDTLLYEELADEKVSIASLTKIMTTVVALENDPIIILVSNIL